MRAARRKLMDEMMRALEGVWKLIIDHVTQGVATWSNFGSDLDHATKTPKLDVLDKVFTFRRRNFDHSKSG